jgi:hypothetical protein
MCIAWPAQQQQRHDHLLLHFAIGSAAAHGQVVQLGWLLAQGHHIKSSEQRLQQRCAAAHAQLLLRPSLLEWAATG